MIHQTTRPAVPTEARGQRSSTATLIAAMLGLILISVGLYKISRVERTLVGIASGLGQVRNESRIVVAKLRAEDDGLLDTTGAEPEIRFATLDDAQAEIKRIGLDPGAEQLAESITRLDGWLIEPDQEEQFLRFKLEQLVRLRRAVETEVVAHQAAALKASTGIEGAREHAEAGKILVLYPMSDEVEVVEGAKRLSARQAEVANRLEVLRRQRYNRWATLRIEQAVNYFNANVSRYNPFSDNATLIDSLVKYLGEVDPVLLEPAVLELYNYIIERTKGSISEQNKLQLAKRLTDPAIRRKTLGDF